MTYRIKWGGVLCKARSSFKIGFQVLHLLAQKELKKISRVKELDNSVL